MLLVAKFNLTFNVFRWIQFSYNIAHFKSPSGPSIKNAGVVLNKISGPIKYKWMQYIYSISTFERAGSKRPTVPARGCKVKKF